MPLIRAVDGPPKIAVHAASGGVGAKRAVAQLQQPPAGESGVRDSPRRPVAASQGEDARLRLRFRPELDPQRDQPGGGGGGTCDARESEEEHEQSAPHLPEGYAARLAAWL